MTPLQHELLSLIAEHTRFVENDASRPIEGYWWSPSSRLKTQMCKALGREVTVDGAGVARSLLSMAARGWIKANPKASEGTYSFGITEEGSLALEKHRETTGFYVEGR